MRLARVTAIWPRVLPRMLLAVAAFAMLVVAITRQPAWKLIDFDQSFYTTIAYDLDRYRIFSNGVFDKTDSTRDVPHPGMFFARQRPGKERGRYVSALSGVEPRPPKLNHRVSQAAL